MKHKRERLADFEIYKLTNSIENVRTEETFDTEIKDRLMGLIKEPKNIDLTIQSKPWNEEELAELSTIIQKAKKAKQARAKRKSTSRLKKQLA